MSEWAYKVLTALDGVAAVNLAEPSPGDLKRVVDAYAEARATILKLQVERDEIRDDLELAVQALLKNHVRVEIKGNVVFKTCETCGAPK